MHRFFFGESARKLYGAYSAPVGGRSFGPPVLLCYPFGQEQIRAHMAFRQIARLLTRAGRGVLRFDYFGTGDSAGDLEEAEFSVWVDNTRTALEELRILAGAGSLSVIGLRLGAAVATAALTNRKDVARLVLWDPVVSGASFLREMEAQTLDTFGSSWWVNGFPLSEGFRDSLRGLDLPSMPVPEPTTVLHVQSELRSMDENLKARWANRVAKLEEIVTRDPGDWNYLDDVGGILLPNETVRVIVGWLTGEGPDS